MSCSCGCGESRRPTPCGRECCDGCGTGDGNAPGLGAVMFRGSAYGRTWARIRARLSAADFPGLRALTARDLDESSDPTMALLDGWACLGEVLGFYNERLVNETFLRTCTERYSALELARLVGYAPRPGVASDAYLAFTLDDANKESVLEIPTGTRAYSQPGPGETMQPFESDEVVRGAPRWSAMRPRLAEPLDIRSSDESGRGLYFDGIATGLAPGNVLLAAVSDVQGNEHGPVRVETKYTGLGVAEVEPLPAEDRTRVEVQGVTRPGSAVVTKPIDNATMAVLVQIPTHVTLGHEHLAPDPRRIFADDGTGPLALLSASYPALSANLAVALGGTAPSGPTGAVTIHAMRVRAPIHGHNALDRITVVDGETKRNAWSVHGTGPPVRISNAEETSDCKIDLNAVYEQILPGSLVAIIGAPPDPDQPEPDGDGDEHPHGCPEPDGLDAPARDDPVLFDDSRVYTVTGVETVSPNTFNLPGQVTRLTLDKPWYTHREEESFDLVRNVVVYAQNEVLPLAERPITEPVCDGATEPLVLDDYYPGLDAGRRLIVEGERADLGGITGVTAAELVMIADVAHRASSEPGLATNDTMHTYVTLAEPGLTHCYVRDTVTIHGNVGHATHGESRAEVLGSGDASKPMQVFPLRQTPLTYVSAPTPSGVASTLEVRVNDLRWREAPSAATLSAGRRDYLVRTDDDGAISVMVGLGARLPTGRDNVRARYRSGIGAAGNVGPGQISVLASRPNGLVAVTNPIAANGGADRDDLRRIRERTPIGLSALDRVISAGDVGDFARAFAGIGKAKLSGDPIGGFVLTIAGDADVPISTQSTVMRNLIEALARAGDLNVDTTGGPVLQTRTVPVVTIRVEVRKALLLGLRARIRLQPDFLWAAVRPRIEDTLFSAFGFDNRDLGQLADPGIAIAAMQEVRGVTFVDLQAFGGIATEEGAGPATPEQVAAAALTVLDRDGAGMPDAVVVDDDTIVYLSRTATGTLLLTLDEEEP